jgi:hypothetical protein
MLTFLPAGDCPTTNSLSKSNSNLCYDRRSVRKYVFVSITKLEKKTCFFYYQTITGLMMWGALSDDRTVL